MGVLYSTIGVVGCEPDLTLCLVALVPTLPEPRPRALWIRYWSRGDALQGMVIFSLGNSSRMRLAAGLTLIQAFSQYMVNLNVWTHNLLTLFVRSGGNSAHSIVESAGEEGEAEVRNKSGLSLIQSEGGITAKSSGGSQGGGGIHSSSDHSAFSWFLCSAFVVIYSYFVSTSVPHFSTLVSLITSATFLISSYTLPAWFTLRLVGDLGILERMTMWAMIPASLILSGIGLYASISMLIENVEQGEGWSA